MSALARASEHVLAQVHAGTVQSTLERVDRDAELLGCLRRAELLDVAEQDHFAMQWIEVGQRRGQQTDAPLQRDGIRWIDDLGDDGVGVVESGRPPMSLE